MRASSEGEGHLHFAHTPGHHMAAAATAARRWGHGEPRHQANAHHRHPGGREDKDPGSPTKALSSLHSTATGRGAWGTATLAGAPGAAPPSPW